MFNIFRMHMYRVSRAKSTIVIGILFIAFLFFGIGLAYLVYDKYNSTMGSLVGTGSGLVSFTASDAQQFLVQGNNSFLILVMVFAVIFTNCDFTRGFVKNTYSMFEKRRPLVFAKWSALITCVTAIYVVYSFLAMVLSSLCISTFEFGSSTEFFRGFAVVYILLISMVTMAFWITSLFKSPSGGMIIGIMIATGIFATAELLISALIARIAGTDKFILAEYCLDYVFKTYNASMGTADTIRTLVVALVYLALALTMSVFLSDKKDVKI